MDSAPQPEAFVQLKPGAGNALTEALATSNWQGPLRIDLQTSGCCDPALGLRAEPQAAPDDLIQEIEGVRFAISRQTFDLVGQVTIAVSLEGDRTGFVLTSQKPLSEWQGFGVCAILFDSD